MMKKSKRRGRRQTREKILRTLASGQEPRWSELSAETVADVLAYGASPRIEEQARAVHEKWFEEGRV